MHCKNLTRKAGVNSNGLLAIQRATERWQDKTNQTKPFLLRPQDAVGFVASGTLRSLVQNKFYNKKQKHHKSDAFVFGINSLNEYNFLLSSRALHF